MFHKKKYIIRHNQNSMQFENATYKAFHEKSNITAPFAEHQRIKKKKFTDSFWVNSDKSKERQLELGHYTF